MNIRRIAGSLGVTLTFFTAAARADDAPAPSTRDAIDAQLEAGIEEAAEQAHASRTATAIAGAAGAAVLLPAGIALTQRSDAVSQSVGTGLAVNGGVSLLLLALSLQTSHAELLARRFGLRRASGLPHDTLVREREACPGGTRPIVGAIGRSPCDIAVDGAIHVAVTEARAPGGSPTGRYLVFSP